ncbi:hypothetical protein GH714_026179 [Hevea brasiliensis]|uniref:Uncharacterized protein n=1 Tax=Hevea brasiliensis TaxID=3981 RepID=A0A6A6N7Q5_HEVBR|nr:hypothetical protein GH714_026179 [Hevea brasiliensis]
MGIADKEDKHRSIEGGKWQALRYLTHAFRVLEQSLLGTQSNLAPSSRSYSIASKEILPLERRSNSSQNVDSHGYLRFPVGSSPVRTYEDVNTILLSSIRKLILWIKSTEHLYVLIPYVPANFVTLPTSPIKDNKEIADGGIRVLGFSID